MPLLRPMNIVIIAAIAIFANFLLSHAKNSLDNAG